MDSRKLRAIYEALDLGANKQALKLCNVLLKKKDVHIVKALKALALARSGVTQEAIDICSSLQKTVPPPTDETLLNTMLLVYKAADKIEDMVPCYENAWAADPRNENLACGLFFSHVRSANYAKQQQVALKMYKQFPSKDSYYYWAVYSIVMQAKQGGDVRLLQLAEKLMERMEADKKIKTSEALQLYLAIFQLQNKLEQAHTLLTGPLGHLYNVPGERELLLADLLFKQAKFSEARQMYADRIVSQPDEWNAYIGYMNCVMQLAQNNTTVIAEAQNWLDDLVSRETLNRGPNLAQLELKYRILNLNNEQTDLDALLHLVKDYFERFGSKATCSYDLRQYLANLPKEKRAELSQSLNVPLTEGALPATVQKRVTSLQLQRLLGMFSTLESDTLAAHAINLIREYQNSVVGQKIESSERLPGDDLILLSAHALQDLYKNDPVHRQIHLLEAISVLEYGRTVSKQNFQFTLQLVDLYCQAGAFKPAYELYSQLAIRYIQLDTLSYLVIDDGIRLGFFQLMESFFEQALKFYADNSNNTLDFVVQAYVHNSYSKIDEISLLKTKLEKSHQFAIIKTEQLLATVHYSDLQPSVVHSVLSRSLDHDEPTITGLYSNQDLSAFDRWDSVSETEMSQPSFASTSARLYGRDRVTQLGWLRARRIIISLLNKVVNGQDDINLRANLKVVVMALGLPTGNGTPESFDTHCMEIVELLFEANSVFMQLQQEPSKEDVQIPDADFNIVITSLTRAIKIGCAHIEAIAGSSATSTSIPMLYTFIGEILCWVVIVVQQWVTQKTKKKRITEAKAALEPLVVELKQSAETLKRLLSAECVPSHTNGGILNQLDSSTDIATILKQVTLNVNKSIQQTKANILSLLATRVKVITSWPS